MPALPETIIALLKRLPLSAYGALENFLADLVDYQDDTDAFDALGDPDPPRDDDDTKNVVIARQDEMDSTS